MKRPIRGLTLAAAALGACTADSFRPQIGSLHLDATVGRSMILVGDTTSLVFRLRNLGTDSITLSFSTSCQVLPYIAVEADHVVYPDDGVWGCLDIETSVSLAPGDERVRVVRINGGGNAVPPFVALMPGRYSAYARLEHTEFPLRSARVWFTVR